VHTSCLPAAGLGFVPMPACPVYCATKAAARSFTQSMRFQLRETNIKVIDIIPPAVQTDLHDYHGDSGKQARMQWRLLPQPTEHHRPVLAPPVLPSRHPLHGLY